MKVGDVVTLKVDGSQPLTVTAVNEADFVGRWLTYRTEEERIERIGKSWPLFGEAAFPYASVKSVSPG